jgi:hypothetical protein
MWHRLCRRFNNLYALSTEIENDCYDHYDLTKDCVWSFNRLMGTGEDPVFVFSELLQRKDEKKLRIKY